MSPAGAPGRALDAQTLLALGYAVVGAVGAAGLALPLLRITMDLDVLDAEFSPAGAAELAEEFGVVPGTVGAAELEFGFQSLGMTWLPGAVVPVLLIVAAVVGIGAAVSRPSPGDRRHGAVAGALVAALAYSLLALARFPSQWGSVSGAFEEQWGTAVQQSDWVQLTPGTGLILVWSAGGVVAVLAGLTWWRGRVAEPGAAAVG